MIEWSVLVATVGLMMGGAGSVAVTAALVEGWEHRSWLWWVSGGLGYGIVGGATWGGSSGLMLLARLARRTLDVNVSGACGVILGGG
jgi:hypothetical protein